MSKQSSTTSFLLVRRRALAIMSWVYDPFHDEKHALEVEILSLKLYRSLPQDLQAQTSVARVRLAALLHDTSREVIGTNFILEPLLGGYMSGSIAYRMMLEYGYAETEARYIRDIIRNHESFFGLWKYTEDLTEQLLSDADNIEAYSAQRFKRGLIYFKKQKFSNIFLNVYIVGLVIQHRWAPPRFFFSLSRVLHKTYLQRLRFVLLTHKKLFRSLLYKPVYFLLYSLDFLAAESDTAE